MIHKKHRYISKLWHPNSKELRGFVVRVPGFKRQAFYGHDYNGMIYALQEAIHYRNDQMKTYNALPDYTGNLVNVNNRSGMIGIIETDHNIVAVVKNNNKHSKVTYSKVIYGYNTALKLAIDARINSKSLGGIRSPMPKPIRSALND